MTIMKKINCLILLILSINSFCQTIEKIDYYEEDTLLSIWASKINFAIKNYTESSDTIKLGVDTFYQWDRKTNIFISSVLQDTIIYGSDSFEDMRLKFNLAVDEVLIQKINCDSIVPCNSVIPCNAVYTSSLYNKYNINCNNLSEFYKHEEILTA